MYSEVNKRWESLLSFLTGIETIPAVVHVGIELVVEADIFTLEVSAKFIIADPDRLGRSVLSIGVFAVKDQGTNIISLACISIPVINEVTIRNCLC